MKQKLLLPIITLTFLFLTTFDGISQETDRNKMIARAAALELKTEYKAPPGDALSHNTSGYAKIMCSAVFITGLKPEFAAENVGYFQVLTLNVPKSVHQ